MVSPNSTERSFTTAVRRVAEIRIDDNEKRVAVATFLPPGKTKRCPGGRVGSSSCACTEKETNPNVHTVNINKRDNLHTYPALMKTQCMHRNDN